MSPINLNVIKPVIVAHIEPFNFSSLVIPDNKNMAIERALQLYAPTPIANVISAMRGHLNSQYKYVLVDVKLHNLSIGEVPCIPGWHLDGGPDVESEYLLCVAGSSLTQFNTEDHTLEYSGEMRPLCHKMDQILLDCVSFSAPEWGVVKYGNLNPHRGAPAMVDGPRLLVRVMGSNKIRAQTEGKFQTSKYKVKDV